MSDRTLVFKMTKGTRVSKARRPGKQCRELISAAKAELPFDLIIFSASPFGAFTVISNPDSFLLGI